MALKLKYTDEHGILHINMSPTSSSKEEHHSPPATETSRPDISDPQFDTINSRFAQYDLFGGKYDGQVNDTSGGEDLARSSLFRSRYNSIEEELANTPYAFTTDRTLHLNNIDSNLDITIKSRGLLDDASPSKDIEDDRFFNRNLDDSGLFGPQLDFQTSIKSLDDTPAFTVTQLIHAQDRYFDLSSRQSSSLTDRSSRGKSGESVVKSLRSSFEVRSAPSSARKDRSVTIVDRVTSGRSVNASDDAFKVLPTTVKSAREVEFTTAPLPVVPTAKRKRESSFAILTETPVTSRPTSPRSLPPDSRSGRISPFRGRGFREETSRHTTPKTSAANSRANSPPRRRTCSLSKIDKMAAATLPPPVHSLPMPPPRPHTPRDFVRQNIEEIRELSELNREKHEAEAEQKRLEEEEALLKEMGILDKTAKLDRSVTGSRTTSRSNSPSKINLRSRSNSPSTILHYEIIPADSKEFINREDGVKKPVVHNSRVRAVSRSQPQSNNGSPKHSKIPKRQNSVSPNRSTNRWDASKKGSSRVGNNLNKNQRFISSSTSSINETIKIGSSVHDKRAMSKSTQHLSISPALIRGKPPISPGRGGPPPSNRTINAKRLSPIVGTPNKSPVESSKPASARTPTKPTPLTKKPAKTAGNTPATSRLNSRQPSRPVSRDPSPEKRRTVPARTPAKPAKSLSSKPVTRTQSNRTPQKPNVPTKAEPKKPINRTNSMKSLTRIPSTKNLNEKPPLDKKDSKASLKSKVGLITKMNDFGLKKDIASENNEKETKVNDVKEKNIENSADLKKVQTSSTESGTDEIVKQDIQTQVDNTITNEKGELVILTKKSIVSMTTAAITAQPLEIVTTVTNQLPNSLEKAREKGMFERHGSKDSLGGPAKENSKENQEGKIKTTQESASVEKENKSTSEKAAEEKKSTKEVKDTIPTPAPRAATLFVDDGIKLKPLQPPYNNLQVERVKAKIDDILKSPEVSSQNILAAALKEKDAKSKSFKSAADKTKTEIKDVKNEVANKITDMKNQAEKQSTKAAEDIRKEATQIVNSIITPVEEPKELKEALVKEEPKTIEPIVMVVNEKKTNGPSKSEIVKMKETLVKGDADVEVQSSNMSTPVQNMQGRPKMGDAASDKSGQSNGGFPHSGSTTPKPPPRPSRVTQPPSTEEGKRISTQETSPADDEQETGRRNICSRFLGKCAGKSTCCPCCVKPQDVDDDMQKITSKKADQHAAGEGQEKKEGMMAKWNCCKKKEKVAEEKAAKDLEMAAGKVSIDFENETQTKRTRKLRDVLCGWCARRRRVSDASTDHDETRAGCCGARRGPPVERRDSILSDKPPSPCCNNRLCNWLLGACRRRHEPTSSRRPSIFSKNKSLSPTLPSEDTRPKLDPTLIEHTSTMRGAIPVLPAALAYFCLVCNILVPGLGTIFSGMFCLCFGIPRFGPHDGLKHRIGAFVMDVFVGAGQLFTVLFCLVGWGWSIWWGVIMVRVSRKYRRLRAEAAAEEEAGAPPVTANNHTRA